MQPMTSPAPLPPAGAPEFRASPGTHPRGVPPEERIFVNRNLRLRSIGAVGFDLDYTLARYRVHEIDDLAFRITQQKLVERGHPEEILQARFEPGSLVRGLVVDRRRGNVLKMDYHNYVVRAAHGFRPLSDTERKRVYRARRIRTSGKDYASIDTFFHLPEIHLYLALVELYDSLGKKTDYPRLHREVRESIDQAHADGSIKTEIAKDPGRFVDTDERLPTFLRMLREAGKKVFLLTNSELFYSDLLLRQLLEIPGGGAPWRTDFDLVLVDAGKPRFFTDPGRPGKWLEAEGPGAPVYSGGDVANLERLLGFKGDSILYWGDHTYGDILRSKKSVGWRTAMIIPELEEELLITAEHRPSLSALEKAIAERDRVILDEDAARTDVARLGVLVTETEGSAPAAREELLRRLARAEDRVAGLAAERARLHGEIARLDDECNAAYHPKWGPLFREGNEISRFGHQVKDFACIYTSRVSNLLHYPANTYFRAPRERMPHEL